MDYSRLSYFSNPPFGEVVGFVADVVASGGSWKLAGDLA